MILEGGAITVDGEGTLITTEQCLLHPNRNPELGREEIEAELKARLGVTKIIWLPYGGALDTETDGHVDGVCAFAAPGKVVVQLPADPAHPDYVRMRANRTVLEHSTDAQGRPFEIVDVTQAAFVEVDDVRVEVGYLNFYVANGGVVVPVADHPEDAACARRDRRRVPRPQGRRRAGPGDRLRRRRRPLHHPADPGRPRLTQPANGEPPS